MRNISNDRPSVTKQREHLLQTLKKTLEFCGVGIHGNDLWTFNEGLLWCEFMNKLIEIEIKARHYNVYMYTHIIYIVFIFKAS